MNMMNEVDVLVGKLKEKHGEKYTPVQLYCWAHMINTHKHDSLDSPPKKSFFGKRCSDAPGVSPVRERESKNNACSSRTFTFSVFT